MANLFDTTNAARTEPEKVVAGDRLVWKRTDLNADYANSAFTLEYVARLEGTGSTKIEITASASGSDYLIEGASRHTASHPVAGRCTHPINNDSKLLTTVSRASEVVANHHASTTDLRPNARIMLNL
ncbi:MAG: hypothetical protein CMM16_00610 [Rhodospirillaceae bacterium]|nr:hypothetical protein [Rhodospirillaceae bacterium]